MAPGLVERPAPAIGGDGPRSGDLAATSNGTNADPLARLAAATAGYDDTLRFHINGTPIVLDNADPEATLLEYLRGIGLTGTKLGCAEGGCGACTVVISQLNPTTGKIYHAAVNACLAPLISVDGKHVITVEGIGTATNPHAIQQRLSLTGSSQCGFCTPGIIMSMYALVRNNPKPTPHDVEEAFDGNLCRCTGYRPILDAAQSFSAAANGNGNGAAGCAKSKANGGTGCCKDGDGDGCGSNGEDTPTKSFPRPDFIDYYPDTELIFPPALRKHEFRPLAFGNKRKKWYRPATLQQLLEIKAAFPSAKIIGGSTETQIETKFGGKHYAAAVYVGDIPELRQFALKDDHVELGGNVALTDVEGIMEAAIEHYGAARAQPFAAILTQLKYFAGRQIRNVGTPAGNLATASPISDLNPVFVATNTFLVAKSLDKETLLPMSDFFKAYRTTALPPDAIIASLRIPVAREEREFCRAYKQAKRKDDDIAIVNAALRVSLDADLNVESADFVYGGLAPVTIAAKKTMAALQGKPWASKDTLEGAMSSLAQDFDLRFGVPGGMASYRKSLALGFFYRFYHETLAALNGDADLQAISEIERDISSGQRDHDVALKYEKNVLGKERPHVAALKQCTGEAQYTDDIPPARNELYGVMVLSTRPHAKILSVDPAPALAVPGVYDYVCHTDLPNEKANWWGAPTCDELFFAVDKVTTVGQPIGLIVAASARQAETAARLVKVEYEDLPAVLTIEEAIAADSFFSHYRFIKDGDAEAAFAQAPADRVFEGVVRMGGQEHFYLETQACVVIPKPEDGEMEVWSSTQNTAETQTYVAQVTGVAANKIVTKVKRMGGGFGGKETRSVQLAGILAVAAKKTRRPVRCMLNRDEDFATSGQRHPFLARWKLAVDKDNKILALDADVFCNGGHTQDLSGAVVERSMTHIDGVYKIPNVHVRGRIAKTNTPSNTAFRGFGGPQGIFIAETYMEEVADHLGIPADEFRRINMYKAGDKTHFRQELKDYYVPLMYQQVVDETAYTARRAQVDEYNRAHKWTKKGLALIPTKFGISFTALFLNQAGALVHIYHDGSVLVAHGGTEMGQGLHTKMCMVAAECLGIAVEDVHISETATNTVANASSTAASASSDLNGYALWNACTELRERLKPYYEKLGADAPLSKIAHAAYFDRVNLTAQGFYKTPDIGYVWGENRGQMFYYFTAGVAAAEVTVDTLTGSWTCNRADIKMDVGRSINPAIDYGQIEGAFVQGMGLFTMEEMLWHRATGGMATKGPGAYKIPGFRDVPQVFNVSLLKDVEWENLRTIQRSRGVGEPPLFLGSVVFFAIRDALKAARAEHDAAAPVLSLNSPATVERIRLSCLDPIVQRSRVEAGPGERSFFVTI